MEEKDIRDAVNIFEKQKKELLSKVEVIDSMLEDYQFKLMKIQQRKGDSPFIGSIEQHKIKEIVLVDDSVIDSDFPVEDLIDDQIIYVFNKLSVARRLPDVENEFKKLSGTDRVISSTARRMKVDGKLVAAKFNNSNRQAFWGLPEWVENIEGKKTYKEERRPSKSELQSGYNTIEFL